MRATAWLRVVAVVVPATTSLLCTLVLAGVLPPPLALVVVVSVAAAACLLWCGTGEAVVCRAGLGTRPLTEAEALVLAPAVALLCRAGLGPPLVDLRVQSRDRGVLAAPWGHRVVVVPSGLVEAVAGGDLDARQAAGSIAHAAAVVRAGFTAREPALGLVCLPWLLLRPLVKGLGRLTVVRLGWRYRLGIVGVAVAQQAVGGHVGLAAAMAAAAGVSYTVPAAKRALLGRVADAGDAAVVALGLGADYLACLQSSGVPMTLKRRMMLRGGSHVSAAGAGRLVLVDP